MADPRLQTLSGQANPWPIAKDIQNSKYHHEDMTFTLNDATGTVVPFKLNPQDFQDVSSPIEVEVPTNAGFFTFRWQVAPTIYQFQAYCGIQGKFMDLLIDQLKGQTDLFWSYPYLGKAARVKVQTIRKVRTSMRPYGVVYDITIRENNPLIKVSQGKITQSRINASFLSPTVYTPPSINANSVAFIDVQTQWDSLQDAAQAVAKIQPNIPYALQFDLMRQANNNMFGTAASPLSGWTRDTSKLPADNQGNKVNRLRYVAGGQGSTRP